MKLNKELEKVRRKLFLIITENYFARYFVKDANKALLKQDREELANEMKDKKIEAVKLEERKKELESKNGSKEIDKELENIEEDINELRVVTVKLNGTIQSIDTVEQQLQKLDQRIKEALWQWRNFDKVGDSLIKTLKEKL